LLGHHSPCRIVGSYCSDDLKVGIERGGGIIRPE
jgi:hypothetical protein